jgi:hypothetical protein
LEHVTVALLSHVAMRQAVEFIVNKRREFLQGSLVTVAPGHQQLRDPSLGRRRHDCSFCGLTNNTKSAFSRKAAGSHPQLSIR